jgi:hypothetical protein
MNHRLTEYVETQRASLKGLRSTQILRWRGLEMAIDHPPDGDPIWTRPDVPCLQLARLDLYLLAKDPISLGTYQNDEVWGICVEPVASEQSPDHPAYRWRDLEELPTGVVDAVTVTHGDEGDVEEVSLVVGGAPLLLMAAEVEPTLTEEVRFVRGDESVLAFVEPWRALDLEWHPPRTA